MAPFGSAAVPDSDFSFFSTLPPLDTRARSPVASSFFSLDDKPEKFVLALIDEASGEPLRPATEADLIELKLLECLPRPEATPRAPKEPEATAMTDQAFKELLSAGPVCRHCGVTESPQWRRGPPNKPILCNACGTRYRRTGQLNHAAQNAASRKRATHSDCAREMAGEKARALKQPRVVA